MRIDQTPTACDAYHAHRASGLGTQQRARILALITANSEIDWSIGEIAHFLSMEKSTVSARLNEMLNADELVPRPARKDRRSGVTVRPVGLPVVGQGRLFE